MAARAFITIACILSGLSVVCLVMCAVIKTDSNHIVFMISKALPFVSFVAGIIGLAVGIAFVTAPGGRKISSAAFVGIAAVVINMIGAALALLIR
ncbi:unnamed protein product [Rotaria sp. Silwood2]|nr:unnamed protein product [Rotaria sp. Silwood2]CAF4647217.1 unnamed protein product [Rotaria sp. Silwood2]